MLIRRLPDPCGIREDDMGPIAVEIARGLVKERGASVDEVSTGSVELMVPSVAGSLERAWRFASAYAWFTVAAA